MVMLLYGAFLLAFCLYLNNTEKVARHSLFRNCTIILHGLCRQLADEMSHLSSYCDKLRTKLLRRQREPSTATTMSADSLPFHMKSTNRVTQASDVSATRARLFDREQLNLDAHQLVLCGTYLPDLNLLKLRQTIDYTKVFGSGEACKRYLQETPQIISFVVCADSLGEQFISEINDLHNVRSIYLYFDKSVGHEQWLNQYSKVR